MKKMLLVLFSAALFGSCMSMNHIDPVEYIPKKEIVFTPVIWSNVVETWTIQKGVKIEDNTHLEYYLYFGTKETRSIESRNSKSNFAIEYTFSHPVESARKAIKLMSDISEDDPHGWYFTFINSKQDFKDSGIVFDSTENGIWEYIPQVVKHCLLAFNNDQDLLMIIYDLSTETTKLFFHPKYCKDVQFHQQKYNTLVAYLNSVEDFSAEIKISDFD